MKRLSQGLVASLLVGCLVAVPQRADAVFGEEDWLSGQNTFLFKIWTESLNQVVLLKETVEVAKSGADMLNDMMAGIRTIKRYYDLITNYKIEDLIRDAKAGFYEAIPEAADLEESINELVVNGKALKEGPSAYFSTVTTADRRMSRLIGRGVEHGIQASIWPIMFPEAMKFQKEPTKVQEMIQRRYLETGEQTRHAVQNTGMGVLKKKIDAFIKATERPDINVELKAQTTMAAMQLQQLQNSTEMRNDMEIRTAKELKRIAGIKSFNAKARKGLAKAAELMMEPGGFK